MSAPSAKETRSGGGRWPLRPFKRRSAPFYRIFMAIDPTDGTQPVANPSAPSTPIATTPTQPQATTPAPSATPDATPALVPQPSPAPGSASPAQATQTPQNGQLTATQPGTVSNTPPAHPSIQRASTIRQVAVGPRYSETIDPQSGATVKTQLPMIKTDIGMPIALGAISASLAGAACGPWFPNQSEHDPGT
jgi:hypothetical protein